MDSSILLARLWGPFIVLVGAALLLNKNIFLQIEKDFFKNSALIYLAGLITFVSGLAAVIFHNIWAADWRVIITVLGWMTLIKGAWLVAMPGTVVKLAETFIKNIKLVLIPWAVMIVIGIFLIVKGYL